MFYPQKFLLAIQTYSLIAFLRLLTIYLLPLDAPPTIIPLKDPFVEFFGGGNTLLKDLFFSGHTATMFLFFLLVNNKLKIVFFISTILVAIFVLIQHVHYTIDVVAAPFFTYGSYKFISFINRNYLIK